jgi:hypothetical protein
LHSSCPDFLRGGEISGIAAQSATSSASNGSTATNVVKIRRRSRVVRSDRLGSAIFAAELLSYTRTLLSSADAMLSDAAHRYLTTRAAVWRCASLSDSACGCLTRRRAE